MLGSGAYVSLFESISDKGTLAIPKFFSILAIYLFDIVQLFEDG